MTGFVFSELSRGGAYRTNWYCTPPEPGTVFRVTREAWTTGQGELDVRDVFEFEALEGEVRT